MKVLPILLMLSLLSVTQGRRDNIRHQVRKRNALLQSVDIAGVAKSGGTGVIGTQTQLLHTLDNMAGKVPLLKPEESPKSETPTPGPPVITGFGTKASPGTDSNVGTEGAGSPVSGTSPGSNTDPAASQVGSSKSPSDGSSGGSDGHRGNRNEKRSAAYRSSLRKATE